MFNFILEAIFWTLALYGLIEIITTIYYICTYDKGSNDGMNLIVAVKNQENQIEGFCRSILFRYLTDKRDNLNKIIVTDLNSTDKTCEIIKRIEQDFECVEFKNWNECKAELDNIWCRGEHCTTDTTKMLS